MPNVFLADCYNISYPSEILLKLKSRENSFTQNTSFSGQIVLNVFTKYDNITVLLCAKCQNDLTTENCNNSWANKMSRGTSLAHCGLVTPYVGRDLGQHCFRHWLVAWGHRAITWTNVDLSSLRSSDVYLRAISLEISQPSVTKISMKIIFPRFYWNLPGANELHFGRIFHITTSPIRIYWNAYYWGGGVYQVFDNCT